MENEPEARTHALIRTSPKGTPFVGACSLCGKEGLKFEDAHSYCENPRGFTQGDSLLKVLI